jgi:hypothetical protein
LGGKVADGVEMASSEDGAGGVALKMVCGVFDFSAVDAPFVEHCYISRITGVIWDSLFYGD